ASALSVDTVSSGDAGNLVINTEQLNVTDGGNVFAGTRGEGNGGSLTVYASESINVIGKNQLGNNFSIITSATENEGSGAGGNVFLATPYLRVAEGGSISAATFASGNGGNIEVQANLVEVSDAAIDFAGVLNGIVTFVAPESFDVDGDVLPAAIGDGGNITLNANQLMISRGGQIDSSTFGSGAAGNLDLNVETVTLSGISDVLEDGTQISSRIVSMSETDGAAGTITIQGDTLTVQDGAEINVSNSSMGDAGNLNVLFNTVRLDRQGQLLAEVNGGKQGNINVTATELLLLRRGSSITTNATNTSTGGNIVIDAPIILGIPEENSDIVANAMAGNGGTITIQTQGLFGLEFRDRTTPKSDITVSSDLGIDGTVTIARPSTDVTSDTLELPETFQDASNQIATNCLPGDNTLLLTGRGGMPHSATTLHSDSPWIDRRLPTNMELSSPELLPVPNNRSPLSPLEAWQEATDMEITPDGTVQLLSPVAHQPNNPTCVDQHARPL
ncbi:MAG: S-layer family protein, partial [Cyanobacteria bacterium J06642_11]